MRAIGRLHDETHARRLGQFLYGEGIHSEVEPDDEGRWTLWILEDDDLEVAREHFQAYVEAPDDPRFEAGARRGREAYVADRKKPEKPLVIDARQRILEREREGDSAGFVTIGLVISAIAVYILQQLGASGGDFPDVHEFLMISTSRSEVLPEILGGQVWRLFTPALLHFGLLHVIFNVFWTKDLGAMLERAHGSLFLGWLVLSLAIFSNLAQYAWSGPNFGGLSGVVYGLFGYAWVRGKLDRGAGYKLANSTVVLMMAWFVLCLTPLLPFVANGAHAAGLAMGAGSGALGAWAAGRNRRG